MQREAAGRRSGSLAPCLSSLQHCGAVAAQWLDGGLSWVRVGGAPSAAAGEKRNGPYTWLQPSNEGGTASPRARVQTMPPCSTTPKRVTPPPLPLLPPPLLLGDSSSS